MAELLELVLGVAGWWDSEM